jgi:ribosomal protein L32
MTGSACSLSDAAVGAVYDLDEDGDVKFGSGGDADAVPGASGLAEFAVPGQSEVELEVVARTANILQEQIGQGQRAALELYAAYCADGDAAATSSKKSSSGAKTASSAKTAARGAERKKGGPKVHCDTQHALPKYPRLRAAADGMLVAEVELAVSHVALLAKAPRATASRRPGKSATETCLAKAEIRTSLPAAGSAAAGAFLAALRQQLSRRRRALAASADSDASRMHSAACLAVPAAWAARCGESPLAALLDAKHAAAIAAVEAAIAGDAVSGTNLKGSGGSSTPGTDSSACRRGDGDGAQSVIVNVVRFWANFETLVDAAWAHRAAVLQQTRDAKATERERSATRLKRRRRRPKGHRSIMRRGRLNRALSQCGNGDARNQVAAAPEGVEWLYSRLQGVLAACPVMPDVVAATLARRAEARLSGAECVEVITAVHNVAHHTIQSKHNSTTKSTTRDSDVTFGRPPTSSVNLRMLPRVAARLLLPAGQKNPAMTAKRSKRSARRRRRRLVNSATTSPSLSSSSSCGTAVVFHTIHGAAHRRVASMPPRVQVKLLRLLQVLADEAAVARRVAQRRRMAELVRYVLVLALRGQRARLRDLLRSLDAATLFSLQRQLPRSGRAYRVVRETLELPA